MSRDRANWIALKRWMTRQRRQVKSNYDMVTLLAVERYMIDREQRKRRKQP